MHFQVLVDFLENPQERVRVSTVDKLVSIFAVFRDDNKRQIIPTIEAILGQTHTNIELFIINDGSEDKEFFQKVVAFSRKGHSRAVGLELPLATEKM